jgi:hypothetical protein
MDKAKLEKHYKNLNEMTNEFLIGDNEYGNGSNRNKRDAGFKKMENVLFRFEIYVSKDKELYEYLVKNNGIGAEDYFYWDELKSFKYFGKDMPRILSKMENELK